jgi:hypothetical protein
MTPFKKALQILLQIAVIASEAKQSRDDCGEQRARLLRR